MDLIADIGATNTRCALLDARGRIARTENFLNTDFDKPEALLRRFVEQAELDRAALAVAAPIAGDEVTMININWRFSQKALMGALGVDELTVLNDFEALAHALPQIAVSDCHPIGSGRAEARAPRAVIGPGSGLGVATAAPYDDGWTAISGEGGHVTLPGLSEAESLVIRDHADPNGHCSAERLLSGPGIVRIYLSLASQAGENASELTPAKISERAAKGDEIARQTYDIFFSLLGTVAGNLALTVGARGGIYIAGGIVPRMIDALERSAFRERFVDKGRYRDYLNAIPTCVITAELPAFLGLRTLLGNR